MTERAASRTAVLVCQARAVADERLAVGRFADPIARDLLTPDERVLVDHVREEKLATGWGAGMELELLRATAEVMVPRTVAIDDAVRDTVAPQVVIVGAGLDARVWRMSELAERAVIEVDLPASQDDKRRRAARLSAVAGRLDLVPADLSREHLGDVLDGAGHRTDVPTMWIWEGVVPYLQRDAVAATVAAIGARSAPGSRLAINYQAPSPIASLGRAAVCWSTRLGRRPNPMAGEPQRSAWKPSAIAALLKGHGFEAVADDDLLSLATGLGMAPKARFSLRNGRVLIADR
ncbi:class I SAM-dependent methyltransferase [Solicola gregarius]|uniref:S-adenosyl-L-methionine-dependent methyltransferase n=1 Tax=Solicola gregarius TaxID=2908642 RepID=A0AA46YMH4_9ACTN|nr:SAM-dependent methyltransferase [Solicola gregarius]UYM06629.1 SAM-dependent methyltransferase [Solicola gregarius]